MAEIDIEILGSYGHIIRIEPDAIQAEGRPIYTRLVIPLKLDFKPANNGQQFEILNIKSSLYVENSPDKIADALSSLYFYRIHSHFPKDDWKLEFPLDAYRIKKIEEQRNGSNLKIRLDLYLAYGIYEPLLIQVDKKQETKHFLTEIKTTYSPFHEIIIQQSHWIKNVLPALGYLEYFLVEIPKDKKILLEAWEYMRKAEHAFTTWDTKSVFANCREIGELLEKTIKEKFTKEDAASKRWGRFYKGFKDWASFDLHHTGIGVEAKKTDAEHLVLVTKSLIRFAEEILKEKEQ